MRSLADPSIVHEFRAPVAADSIDNGAYYYAKLPVTTGE
jgi:hypothetical protein